MKNGRRYDTNGLLEAQYEPAAVRDGMDRNYGPMAEIFAEVIRRSLVRAEGV